MFSMHGFVSGHESQESELDLGMRTCELSVLALIF